MASLPKSLFRTFAFLSCAHALMILTLTSAMALSVAVAQEAPGMTAGPLTKSPKAKVQDEPPVEEVPHPHEVLAPMATFDPDIFQRPLPADQLTYMKSFAGATTGDAMHDRQFRKLMHNALPDCMFHYGRDMPLTEALDTVLSDSPQPIKLREGRYMVLSGSTSPYLRGRGFFWVDLQTGMALGGFSFHPTNGEPSPTLTISSKQVKEPYLSLGQLPPAFAVDLSEWGTEAGVGPLMTRYFITGANRRILLEHDEDFCSPVDGTVAPSGDACEQMDADAADLDMNTAAYLEQVHYATNATAWMIRDPDQIAWVQVRDHACGVGPDPLGCHIRMTRERTRSIVMRQPLPRPTRK